MSVWRAQVSQPCAPTSSALPKPMEGALWSGAVAARPAGAAGVKAAGLIIANILGVEGQRKQIWLEIYVRPADRGKKRTLLKSH